MAGKHKLYVVLNPHLKSYGGQPLDLGEVFELRRQRNDYVLIKHRYIEEVENLDAIQECADCGRKFIHESGLGNHRRAGHGKHRRRQLGDLEPEGSPALPPVEKSIPKRMNPLKGPVNTGVVFEPEP